MTDNREQSQVPDWADEELAVAGDRLGPFELMAEAEHTTDADGYAVVATGVKVRVRVKDNNTDTFILDQEYDPLFGDFSTLDHDFWKMQAEAAIQRAGYDLQEVFAQARQDNAA